MKPPKFISEIELAEYVIKWLKEQGWEVYQEVQFNSVADIVAVKDNKSWIIECKTAFGLYILEQAYNWWGCANYISIAVPSIKRKKQPILKPLTDSLKIGLITVSCKDWEGNRKIEELFKPPLQDITYENIINYLNEKQKNWAKAGNNRGERYTKFKDTVYQIEEYLKNHPGSTMKEVVKNIKHHYSNDNNAQTAIRQWIEQGIIKNIEQKMEGKYYKYFYKNE